MHTGEDSIQRVIYPVAKRCFDCCFAVVVLVVCAPLLFAIALIILFEDRLPIIYYGKRAGLHGKTFSILKFRSMVSNAEKIGPITTAQNDPRLLKSGKFIRRYKLDELLQFINVLRGEMSIVGPRPEIESVVANYTPTLRQLLHVHPGIVDFGSLWNRHQELTLINSKDPYADYMREIFPIKTQLSLIYVRSRSFLLDMKVILATFLAVFFKIDPSWCFTSEALSLLTQRKPDT